MIDYTNILERISNENLAEQLRRRNPSVFDKLNLSFDQMYARFDKENELDESLCGISCGDSCDISLCSKAGCSATD
jgi:hypothetical protein